MPALPGRVAEGWTDDGGGGTGGVTVHNALSGRAVADAHPMSAITGLLAGLSDAEAAAVLAAAGYTDDEIAAVLVEIAGTSVPVLSIYMGSIPGALGYAPPDTVSLASDYNFASVSVPPLTVAAAGTVLVYTEGVADVAFTPTVDLLACLSVLVINAAKTQALRVSRSVILPADVEVSGSVVDLIGGTVQSNTGADLVFNNATGPVTSTAGGTFAIMMNLEFSVN